MSITKIWAAQRLDSRGNPCVEVSVKLNTNEVCTAVCTNPSEALCLMDKTDQCSLCAVRNVNDVIAPKLMKSGLDPREQRNIDEILLDLDGTDNKAVLGANAILGVSMAVCKAGAAVKGVPLYKHISDLAEVRGFSNPLVLPCPVFNLINGGHFRGNNLALEQIQVHLTGASTFSEAMQWGVAIQEAAKELVKERYGPHQTDTYTEGGISPTLVDHTDTLNLTMDAIKAAGYEGRCKIAIDARADDFYTDNHYNFGVGKEKLTSEELTDLYLQMIKIYPIDSIEQPFSQSDMGAWAHFTQLTEAGIKIVSDDLTGMALEYKRCNAISIKIIQAGTVTQSIDAANVARVNNWSLLIQRIPLLVSGRSGDSEDVFVADLAVGIGADQVKFGAIHGSEHAAKYDRLLRIEEELGKDAKFAGSPYRFYGIEEELGTDAKFAGNLHRACSCTVS